MGLDITAYRNIAVAKDALVDEYGDPADYSANFRAWVNDNFPAQAEGVEDGAIYSFAAAFSFRAGSYSGYGSWRDWLARLAGYPETPDKYGHAHAAGAFRAESGPFHALINFSDCEGVVGPVVAAKLAADFAEWDERAKADVEQSGDPWFYGRFLDWRRAFEMAADGGAVVFH